MRLFELLQERGVEHDHFVRTSIASRFLSAGSSAEHDGIRSDLRSDWMMLETHYGIEFDMRSIACRWAEDSRYDIVIGSGRVDPCDRHAFFANLLWLRGGQVRELQFEIPQQFGLIAKPDRLLVPLPPRNALHVSVGRAVVDASLLSDGEVTIWATRTEKREFANLLREIAVVPTTTEFMNVFPRLTSVVARGREIHCHLELVEVIP